MDPWHVECPTCGAGYGEWCRRHGQTMPGALLLCPARIRATRSTVVVCPVSDIAGPVHTFTAGTGVVIPWDVMGDARETVTVCRECASRVGES